MKCSRCGSEISEGQSYEYTGERLCEDCYIDIRYPVKACDPWAVYAATRSRESSGLAGTDGLTELQKEICEFVKSNGKVSGEDIMKNFGLTQSEVQTQAAVLRHCELVKGHKEGDKVYLVSFNPAGGEQTPGGS